MCGAGRGFDSCQADRFILFALDSKCVHTYLSRLISLDVLLLQVRGILEGEAKAEAVE